MKKFIIILTVINLLAINNTIAQNYPTPVTDTLNYLRYIVSNKQQYIGQPFSLLQSNLLINTKMFFPYAGIHQNRYSETGISLAFKFAQFAEDLYDTYPHLEITWQPPYLNYYESLDLKSLYKLQGIGWNSVIYNRYQNMVIKDIFLYE